MKMKTTRLTPILAVLIGLALSGAIGATIHVNTTSGMTTAGAPLAAHGYDPVAFFTQNRAVLGGPAHMAKHDGAAYRFASAANKAKFEADPSKYAPQFGGFCAYGVSVGAKFDGDPRLFKIVDGKLYFNLNSDIQKLWVRDIPGNITKANGNWAKIRDVAPERLK